MFSLLFKAFRPDPSSSSFERSGLASLHIRSCLGSGGCGSVYYATVPHPVCFQSVSPEPISQFAVKRIEGKSKCVSNSKRLAKREYSNQKAVQNHENIAKAYVHRQFQGESEILMEFIGGPSLQAVIEGRLCSSESQVIQVSRQLFSALRHVHVLGYTHRDVKPENILFTEFLQGDSHRSNLKLIDFGFMEKHETSPRKFRLRQKKRCGTFLFTAPEMYDESQSCTHHPIDIWSAGVTLFYLISSRMPYPARDEWEYLEMVSESVPIFQSTEINQFSPLLLQMVLKCMSYNPSDRPTAADAISILDSIHPDLT